MDENLLIDDDSYLIDEEDDDLNLEISDIEFEDLPLATKKYIEKEIKLQEKEKRRKEKDYHDFIKSIFSSLTARRCRFTFINLHEDVNRKADTVVMTNEEREEFGKYRSITLGVQVVTFKDEGLEFFTRFKEELGVDELTSPYMLIPSEYLSLKNKIKKSDPKPIDIHPVKKDLVASLTYQDKEEEVTKSVTIGKSVNSINVRSVLRDRMNYLHAISTHPDRVEYKLPQDADLIRNQLIKVPIDIHDKHFNIYLMDGVGCPSYKEFLKKHDKGEYSIILFRDGVVYTYCTKYEDDRISVLSTKPFTFYRP